MRSSSTRSSESLLEEILSPLLCIGVCSFPQLLSHGLLHLQLLLLVCLLICDNGLALHGRACLKYCIIV